MGIDVKLMTANLTFLPDFPLISFALRFRALTSVSVRMEFDG